MTGRFPAALALPRTVGVRRPAWTTLGSFALVAATGFAGGGYFPGSWGWATLGAAWTAAAILLGRDQTELARPAAAAAALLGALTAWTALSFLWSTDVTQTALEAERTAVYAAALLAAVLCARHRPERIVHGTWLAITALCGWGLATRLVPDRWGVVDAISGYRLSEPIGYWNSLGLMAGMGTLLGLGIAARGGSRAGRAVAAATLPVLVTTLYFTYSRGGWLALGLGAVAALALCRRRLQLVGTLAAVVPWIALAVWRASVSPALTTVQEPMAEMAHQGHRLVLVLVLAAAAAAASTLVAVSLERRIRLPQRGRRAAQVALGCAVAAGVLAVFVELGSPVSIVRHGWNSFASAPPAAGSNLNSRLFQLSGTGRVTQWRIAWDEAKAYPWLGSGAGTYELYWNRNRPVASRIRNVHNLYLETLAELGPIGLALLLGVLALPLYAVFRRRGQPLAFAAFGAYVAYVLHAIVDWDWEIASVTLVAILCAGVLLAGPAAGRPRRWGRRAAVAAALLLAATGVYTIATRIPMNRLDAAVAHGHWAAATRDAKRAAALAPWSSEPWLHLGEAELNAGLPAAARTAFEKAVGKDAGNWTVWYDLARVTSGRQHRIALARATALNPLSPELAALRK